MPSSTKSIPIMENKVPRHIKLTAEEVCLIMKAGKDADVMELRFQGLEIKYGLAGPAWPTRPVSNIPIPEAVAPDVQAEKSIDNFELRVKTQQMEELPITDPLEYEELLASGELRNTTDGEDSEA